MLAFRNALLTRGSEMRLFFHIFSISAEFDVPEHCHAIVPIACRVGRHCVDVEIPTVEEVITSIGRRNRLQRLCVHGASSAVERLIARVKSRL